MNRSPSLPRRPAVCLVLLLAIFGCTSPRSKLPYIRELYREAALIEARNPVVVIHGALGSRLMNRKTGKIVWGAFTNEAIDPETASGARDFALALERPGPATDYDNAKALVYAAGPLGALRLSLFFSTISVNVYASILQSLGIGGYSDPLLLDPYSPAYAEDHFTCFSFFYDWRRDNVENAIQLGRFLEKKRKDIDKTAKRRIARLRKSATAQDLEHAKELEDWLARGYRFDIVAHSMGGLIARYFLRFGAKDLPEDGSTPTITWAGAEQIDRLVLVGVPNLGSMDAFRKLLRGYQPAVILPKYAAPLLGTFPSLYQLLPRNRHHTTRDAMGRPLDIDFYDVESWDRNNWGLLAKTAKKHLAWLMPEVASEQERRRQAKDYLGWCLARAEQFHRALDLLPEEPCASSLFLFASDTEKTMSHVRFIGGPGHRTPAFSNDSSYSGFGDGTVLRYSALGDERYGNPFTPYLKSPIPWTAVNFMPDDHIGLTNNPQFTNNLLHILLERPPAQRPDR